MIKMKRYASEKGSDGWLVIDRVIGCPVTLPFSSRIEAVARARELEDLVVGAAQECHSYPVKSEPAVYIGRQRIAIESLGPDARRQILAAINAGAAPDSEARA
jgi:hypothetical protein